MMTPRQVRDSYKIVSAFVPRELTKNETGMLLDEVGSDGMAVVVVSQDGDLLAGHHELHAAAELAGAAIGPSPIRVMVITAPVGDFAQKLAVAKSLARWVLGRPPGGVMRRAIAAAIRENPRGSDREIAKRVYAMTGRKPSKNTVAKVRAELVKSRKIDQLPTRIGTDGRRYQAVRKR
jgi:hypothetical protein